MELFELGLGCRLVEHHIKFITNKQNWSGHLMGKAMREVPEEDYKLIVGEG